MPLRCVEKNGASIEATASMTEEEWRKLRRRSRSEGDLTMPCCTAAAIPKTSSRGTRFFAHKAGAQCSWKPEGEIHRAVKASAVEVARRLGWDAQSEAGGASPDGNRWTADVLCRKEAEAIAIEIQWSAQTNEETRRRQERYAHSGITGVWLLRQPGWPIAADLPAAGIRGSLKEGLRVVVPETRQVLEPEVFLAGVLEGRFRFGLPDEAPVSFSVETGVVDCWRCGHPTRIVHTLNGAIGPYRFQTYVHTADRISKLGPLLATVVVDRKDIGAIKPRYSATMGTTYWSNGCANCDALQGQFYEHHALECEEETLGIIELVLDGRARDVIEEDLGEVGWGMWDA